MSRTWGKMCDSGLVADHEHQYSLTFQCLGCILFCRNQKSVRFLLFSSNYSLSLDTFALVPFLFPFHVHFVLPEPKKRTLFAFLLKLYFSLDTFALIPFLFSFPATILFGRNQKSVRFLLMIMSSLNFYFSGPAGTQKAYAFSARFIKNARFLQNLIKRKYIARARKPRACQNTVDPCQNTVDPCQNTVDPCQNTVDPCQNTVEQREQKT